ncbi:TRAP transporter substrate-binding protein [Thalassococcus sp. S3]|uniref:TRAP transporter substrate-binding protein n=1 Tax=Thalassococcus sp. S3 TaxID=2017482 RepID=UPI0010247757|nr:TRAP transporter substrate-binding protein [Thalassococcus sp. S3]QBF30501.1 C4-dicarboxylate ABC transporter substrate-binding protein [Thalassococcus sp. S3]
MTGIGKFVAASVVGLGMATAALAQDTTLRVSTWLPPTHGVNTEIFGGMIEMIEAATDGRVTGELVSGLAPPPAQSDLILDGAADIAIIFHGYQPGRYVATQLPELPGYEGSAEASSVAYWRVFEEHLAAMDEHRGVKVIALNTHGPGQIHTGSDVSTLADLDGLKTRIGGGVAGDVGGLIGLVGINVPAPQVYETLESGAADAVAMNVGERIGFRLDEVAPNLFEMPGGFYRGSFALIMSEETFADLPEDIQTKLDAEVFGEPLSRMAGAAWDLSDELAREAMGDDATTVVASAEDQASFAETTAEIRVRVLEELIEAGVDADAAYQMMVDEMAAVSAE